MTANNLFPAHQATLLTAPGILVDRQYGKIHWSLVKFSFYISPSLVDREIEGEKLQEEVKRKLISEDSCLQYLISHPKKLRKVWKQAPKDTGEWPRRLLFFGKVFLVRNEGYSWPSVLVLEEGQEKAETKAVHNIFFQNEYVVLFRPTWLGLLLQPLLWWELRKRYALR